jgi:hypothetical protein
MANYSKNENVNVSVDDSPRLQASKISEKIY